MKTDEKMKIAAAELGWGGTHADYSHQGGRGSISGCGPLAQFLAEYGYEGCPVIVAPDEQGPMAGAWVETAIRGPMLGINLGPDEVSRFDGRDNIVFTAMVAGHDEGIHTEFTNLCKLAENPKFTGLDEVGLNIYLQVKRLGGARIGKLAGRAVEWEDGTASELPPAAFIENPQEKNWWSLWDWDKSIIPHKGE